jgi:hypothetical protein
LVAPKRKGALYVPKDYARWRRFSEMGGAEAMAEM